MKNVLAVIILTILSISCSESVQKDSDVNQKTDQQEAILKDSSEDLAQQQLDGYNRRDIDAFLVPYSEDVEVYIFPNELVYTGKETMREKYAQMFERTPNLHCEIVSRIVKGNIVIDEESVQMGDKQVHAVAIYHIENKKIQKVFFVK